MGAILKKVYINELKLAQSTIPNTCLIIFDKLVPVMNRKNINAVRLKDVKNILVCFKHINRIRKPSARDNSSCHSFIVVLNRCAG